MAVPKTQAYRNVDAVSEFIPFTLTQGGADAFVQATIPTGLLGTGDSEMVYTIEAVIFNMDSNPLMAALAASIDLDLTITRASKAAIPPLTDNDLLAKFRYQSSNVALNVNGRTDYQNGQCDCPMVGANLIAGANIYIQMDSTNFAAAMTITGRMIVKTEKRKKSEILEILYG